MIPIQFFQFLSSSITFLLNSVACSDFQVLQDQVSTSFLQHFLSDANMFSQIVLRSIGFIKGFFVSTRSGSLDFYRFSLISFKQDFNGTGRL